jgi:DNA-binding NarL/FixJ family response regulator
MSGRRESDDVRQVAASLPLDHATWRAVVHELKLCRQQSRIVELILRGMKDKEIAEAMDLGLPTIRTYLGRIFNRVGVRDRMELVLRVFAVAQTITTHGRGHHS